MFFSDPYNDKESSVSIAWFKDTVHMIPYQPNSLFLHIKVGNKFIIYLIYINTDKHCWMTSCDLGLESYRAN